MYKCGWNGCEKAYGTLNHLNAHVTMQAHGQKRTPEGKNNYPVYPVAGTAQRFCVNVPSNLHHTFHLPGNLGFPILGPPS